LPFLKKFEEKSYNSIFARYYFYMQQIHQSQHHHTSITLTPKCRRRLKAAQLILARNGVVWSESEILRRLAIPYLQAWRGNKLKSATARRYNQKYKEIRYVRVSWYIDKVLYSILWQRAIHSGMSISRMLEFAMRYYMPELMESTLQIPVPGNARSRQNWRYWQKRYEQRRRPKPKIFVIYQSKTMRNTSGRLKYRLKYEIWPFKRLWQGPLPKGYAFLH
jgi:hypothetical protein